MTTKSEEKQILSNVNDITSLLAEGKFIDAMEKYLADDVQLYEGNNAPKVGKEFCIIEEKKLLETVTDFYGYKVISGPSVQGNTTFYEAVMGFKTNDGVEHEFEQVVRTKWRNGKIINERYYHA